MIEPLMEDHVAMTACVRRISETLDDGQVLAAGEFTAELADMFGHHVSIEQAGLFAQLREAGEATLELHRLVDAHAELNASLFDARVVENAPRLRRVLADLLRLAEMEDIDSYSYALQRLPVVTWGLIREAHQLLLTA